MLSELKDMPVLVTGAGGFIGYHLVAELLAQGAQVHAVLRPGSTTKRLANLAVRPQTHHLDVTETEQIEALVDEIRPRIVYSLAVSRINDDPDALFQTNVAASLALMEACRHPEFSRFVTIGSSLERSDLRTTPYARSRHQAAVRLRGQAKEQGIAYTHLRTYYVYGPSQAENKLIPRALQSLKKGVSLPVASSESRKDFVHVSDVVRACIAAAHAQTPSYITADIASGEQWRVTDVLRVLQELSHTSIPTHQDSTMARIWDDEGQHIDLDPARELLGWAPEITLRDGLQGLLSAEAVGHDV